MYRRVDNYIKGMAIEFVEQEVRIGIEYSEVIGREESYCTSILSMKTYLNTKTILQGGNDNLYRIIL